MSTTQPYNTLVPETTATETNVIFYSTVNIQFLPRAAMHTAERRLYRRKMSVYLTVRPSVRHTPVLCLNGYAYPQNFFTVGYSPVILVLPRQTSTTGAAYRGRRMQGGMKNHDVRSISRFISELMQDRAIVTMEGE